MIFLTEHKYKNIDTPRINAKDWEEAESICPSYLRVIGKFLYETDINPNNN